MTAFKIYYQTSEFFRDGIMGVRWLNKVGKMPTRATLDETHVFLRSIDLPGGENQLERVMYEQQAETWSPNGEARDLIQGKGLSHTSMSMGDIVVVGDDAFIVDSFGFVQL